MLLSRHSVGTYHENELTRNSSGNTRSQSSQLSEPPWTDPGLKSEISVRELISTLKKKKERKKKKRRRGMNCGTFSPNHRMRGKCHHPLLPSFLENSHVLSYFVQLKSVLLQKEDFLENSHFSFVQLNIVLLEEEDFLENSHVLSCFVLFCPTLKHLE